MWRDDENKQRARTFDRKIDADRFLSTIEADLVRGQYIDPGAGQVTLNAYTAVWVEAQVWRQSTRQASELQIKNHIGPALGSRPLARITRTDVQGFVRQLEQKGLAPSTVRTIYTRLVSILESALHDRIIARSPAVKIALPKMERRQSDAIVLLDMADVRRMADTVPDWVEAFVWTMVMSGLRPGEAAGLTVERLDLDRRAIVVDRQMLTSGGAPMTLAPPKTDASIRTVPIPDQLVDELRRHMARFQPIPFEDGATLIFASRARRPLRRSTMAGYWTNAREKLELPKSARGWHTLRHTYASLLIHGGLSVKAVQARLGHASATETLDVYSHLWPDSDDDTRNVIDAALKEDLAG